MLVDFARTLAALADVMVMQNGTTLATKPEYSDAVSRFLMDVHARMPGFLRLPFRILTLVFDGWSYFSYGRPFHRLKLAQRAAQIEAWRNSSLEVRRRYIEFFGTLAVFGLYSELYGADYEYAGMVERV